MSLSIWYFQVCIRLEMLGSLSKESPAQFTENEMFSLSESTSVGRQPSQESENRIKKTVISFLAGLCATLVRDLMCFLTLSWAHLADKTPRPSIRSGNAAMSLRCLTVCISAVLSYSHYTWGYGLNSLEGTLQYEWDQVCEDKMLPDDQNVRTTQSLNFIGKSPSVVLPNKELVLL